MGSALKGVASGHRDKGLASNATGEPNQFMVDEQVKRTQKWNLMLYPCFHDYFKFSWLFLKDSSTQENMIDKNTQM